jgi:hypothetical protein
MEWLEDIIFTKMVNCEEEIPGINYKIYMIIYVFAHLRSVSNNENIYVLK